MRHRLAAPMRAPWRPLSLGHCECAGRCRCRVCSCVARLQSLPSAYLIVGWPADRLVRCRGAWQRRRGRCTVPVGRSTASQITQTRCCYLRHTTFARRQQSHNKERRLNTSCHVVRQAQWARRINDSIHTKLRGYGLHPSGELQKLIHVRHRLQMYSQQIQIT